LRLAQCTAIKERMNLVIFSTIFGVIMMFMGIWQKNALYIRNSAIVGMVILFFMHIVEMSTGNSMLKFDTHGFMVFDRMFYIFNAIILFCTIIYLLLSGRDIVQVGTYKSEYFALIFFIQCGIALATSYQNLLMLFLGIEIISIPLYILTGSDKRNLKSNEAALKYFLMGAFSTGIMLMGIAFIYGSSGSFDINVVTQGGQGPLKYLFTAGILLLFVAISFKVSAAPFHFWTPDVYDGAPTVFTAFMATMVKAAGFFAFVKMFEVNGAIGMGTKYSWVIAFIIIATLLVGNITAVFQQSVKRMLSYSSIAQAGFMMFALYSFNSMSKEGLLLYTAAYCLATLGIFGILIRMKDYTFDGFNGLAKTHPVLAATNTVFLLSLAGIPLTAGFFAKYFMLASAVKSGQHLWLVIIAVLFAAVSVYYYFRIIQAMYFKANENESMVLPVSSTYKVILIVIAALIILLGIFPQFILQFMYFN
jgi:NADH-quinone oxidoreductase subunit N